MRKMEKMRKMGKMGKMERMGKLALIGFILLIPIISFQNCAEEPIGGEDLSSSEAEGEALDPVAFDTLVDTLGYMSCQSMGSVYNKRAYFSFKIGAYRSGSGMRFTDSYFDSVKDKNIENKVKPIKETENNLMTYLQMSIHQQGSYRYRFNLGTHTGKEGVHYRKILGPQPLSNDIYVGQLAQLEDKFSRINYFRGLSNSDKRLIEGHLQLVSLGSNYQKVLRHSLEDTGTRPALLTFGYTKGGLAGGDLIGPDQSPADKKAFGRGYRLSFGNGHCYQYNKDKDIVASCVAQGDNSQIQRRALVGVTEVDLNGGTSSSGAGWNCPSWARFMIFRPQDVKSGSSSSDLMPCGVDANGVEISVKEFNLNSEQRAIYRILQAADWSVDFQRRCVVPKQNGGLCYGSNYNQQNSVVNYYGLWAQGRCDVVTEYDLNSDGSLERISVLCPHYINVCFRNGS